MTSGLLKFGLIGFGAWGRCHANAIAKTKDAELAAISAPSEASRAAAHEAFPSAQICGDYRELLARDDIELVDIVVPSYLHHEITSAALKAGKNVLLEKPLALSLEQCDDLIRIAREQKRVFAVGHELRLSSLWGKVKEMIDAGFVGDPLYALVELSRRPYRQGSNNWRYDISRVGSWILEEPIHFFDFARWYLSSAGEPQTVYATSNSRQPGHPELKDNFSAIVNFANGAYAVVSQTLAAFEHHQTVKVTGTKGAVWASWSGAMDRTLHPTFSLRAFDGENVQEVKIDKITGEVFELEDQMAMLVNAIRRGGKLSCGAEDGRWSVAMCLAAQQSVDCGQPVTIRDVG
ncbi:MAG TPA: Gfo/Idh/MocA family oxidoreductase [Lacipirellulaceae bacterium]|jgi:myo-inositol 2-dehydrogenase/D-chiro-inositol 1-dehydrogenase|nr:Gfo/Idh/MocA family oxidoreductase [Lacipirellulaceae bacterium]